MAYTFCFRPLEACAKTLGSAVPLGPPSRLSRTRRDLSRFMSAAGRSIAVEAGDSIDVAVDGDAAADAVGSTVSFPSIPRPHGLRAPRTSGVAARDFDGERSPGPLVVFAVGRVCLPPFTALLGSVHRTPGPVADLVAAGL